MPKRKRTTPPPPDDPTQISSDRLTHILSQPLLPLSQAFKLAKAFERQRLGRRLKTAHAQHQPDDVSRIEQEITVLKGLDYTSVAKKVLGKKVRGVKGVQLKVENEPEVGRVLNGVFGLVGKGEGKVEEDVLARLVNSGPVGKVVVGCVNECLGALGVERLRRVKKKRLRKKDFETGSQVGGEEDGGEVRGKGEEDEGVQENGNRAMEDGESEDEFAGFDDRVAGSSDDESGDEDVEDLERQLAMEGVQQYDDAEDDISGSDQDMHDLETSSPEPRKSKSQAKMEPVKGSAFLPSLSMGGYISDSGSDIEAIDVEPPRKNRPGQRARQLAAEKKYGNQAKHLQKQKQDRKAGWDPKRGATDGTERRDGKGRFPIQTGMRNGLSRPQSNGVSKPQAGLSAPVKKHRDDSGPIHPSWEAAKKAKEKRDAPVAFQGKKVVFD